jgi:hypothetical protein
MVVTRAYAGSYVHVTPGVGICAFVYAADAIDPSRL